MATLSLDLRKRIIAACDKNNATRGEIAERFGVSLGMVKKLLQQRRTTGSIESRHHLAGRKKLITEKHRATLRKLLQRKPDMTLAALREALDLDCSLPAIHYVLRDMGLRTPKKRGRARPAKPAAKATKKKAAKRPK